MISSAGLKFLTPASSGQIDAALSALLSGVAKLSVAPHFSWHAVVFQRIDVERISVEGTGNVIARDIRRADAPPQARRVRRLAARSAGKIG
ncbi:hypothetical protein RHA1_ro03185 [Rhodococcus jostii RHA1]|uniref:Uncharacterized protein n=1 Tax=Rhodococcus jostii (strain RHA1) TaxID=101510 RepID=Q0SBU8_RHOJR|nr:hypothetical protein RHA1_ro03185 [Rhodococcus jostii RHA1]